VVLVVTLVALVLTGCGAASSGAQTRRVLVDYSPDDVNTSFFGYYPHFVDAHPGDTIDFHQTWTGEPHTITLGTLTKPVGKIVKPLLLQHKELPEEIDTGKYGLPSVWPQTDTQSNEMNQTAAQPCYVASGPLPVDGVGCPKTQPVFDGTQEFYNSGYIPFHGLRSNEFSLPLASSIKPGEYFYYCLLHGAGMGGFIEVKPKGTALTSPKGRHDADLVAGLAAARKARAKAETKAFRLPHSDVQVGTFSYYVDVHHGPVSVNEFLPATFHAKVGQKVTWSFQDGPGHTVSFDVPPYLPVVKFKKDGSVSINPAANDPHGGPGYPKIDGPIPDGAVDVDTGNYDGTYFLSSGYPDGPMRYSVTFTKPGTYPYACTIHPLMLGKVVVS
jgi:plastocyanin